MIQRSVIILLIGIVGFSFAQQVSGDSLVKLLEYAKTYYNGGDYEKAITELEKALTFLKQLNQIDQVEAYKYLAFSYVAFGETGKAKDQFRKALALDPKLELNPTTVSPKIIKVFEEVKSEIAVKPPITPPVKPPVKPVTTAPASKGGLGATMRSCCVPGWGQMYKGESGKGTKLMITSFVLLGSGVLTSVATGKAHADYLDVDPGDQDGLEEAYGKYKFWYNMAVLSWTGFIVAYGYNLYDVIFTKSKTGSSMIDGKKNNMCFDVDAEHISLGYVRNF